MSKLKAKGLTPIPRSHGVELAKKLGAAKYMECSALTQKGLFEVFEEAVKATLLPPVKTKKKLCIFV